MGVAPAKIISFFWSGTCEYTNIITVPKKEKIGIILIKVEKQGQSSTPADILVDN